MTSPYMVVDGLTRYDITGPGTVHIRKYLLVIIAK